MSDLATLDVVNLLVGFRNRDFSPVDAVEACLAQIDRVEPTVHAVITLCEEQARARAEESERRWIAGTERLLEGVPYGLKDIIETNGIRTTGGSKLYQNHVPKRDAAVAERMATAGGVLVAKLNTFEFAFGEHGAFEPARNPWDPLRTPGGSSSGSAAALAARELPLALGTDTGGSIRVPAAFCGITGYKPTYGLVPCTGVMPLAWSLDHVGPMARSVPDATLALAVLAAPVDRRPKVPTASHLLDNPPQFQIKDVRLGIPSWFCEVCDAESVTAFESATRVFAAAGATLVDVDLPHAGLSDQRGMGWAIIFPELAAAHRSNLDRLEEYGPEFRQRLIDAQQITAVDYIHALRVRERVQADFDEAFQHVDALLTPGAVAVAPFSDDLLVSIDGDSFPWLDVIARTTLIFNLTGMPALTIPAGLSREGLPLGLQIATPPYADQLCLQLGAWYQEHTDHHHTVPPLVRNAANV
jgi:aspartyl-tRNA(Asn)/glutamyl-tRNA(Gln) amidotransferase subunit A